MKATVSDIKKIIREVIEGIDGNQDDALAKQDAAHTRAGNFRSAMFNILPTLENLQVAVDVVLEDAADADVWALNVPVEEVIALKETLQAFVSKLSEVKSAVDTRG